MSLRLVILYLFALVLVACEKEITLDVPPGEPQIVVEGRIELGDFPTVVLTRSLPYYAELNNNTLSSLFVSNAQVWIEVNGDTIAMQKFCLSEVPDSLQAELREQFGLPPGFSDFCVFVGLDTRLQGKVDTRYNLIVEADAKRLNASTFLPKPVALDSLWFKPDGDRDSLGFIYAQLSDPGTQKNHYRWYTQRINSYLTGKDSGQIKDPSFIAPFNSVFDDEYFNGLTFPFAYNRGSTPDSQKEDDNNIERGYFKKGDTIVVKFSSIDESVYLYYRDYYYSVGSTGSPFAAPTNVRSNIKGGLGVWAAYGVYLDTLVIR